MGLISFIEGIAEKTDAEFRQLIASELSKLHSEIEKIKEKLGISEPVVITAPSPEPVVTVDNSVNNSVENQDAKGNFGND